MNASIPILSVVIGAVVLLFGRKLFWLCVAAIGFAAGVTLASHLVNEPTPLLQLTFAILLGFIGALLALFLKNWQSGWPVSSPAVGLPLVWWRRLWRNTPRITGLLLLSAD